MKKIHLPKRLAGFSLIEVVISFAILSGLGIALVQSQLSATRMVTNSYIRDQAAEFIENKLQEIERTPKLADNNVKSEKFNETHPLYPGSWSIVRTNATLIMIPVSKVTCTVTTIKNEKTITVSNSIILTTIDADYLDIEDLKNALSKF